MNSFMMKMAAILFVLILSAEGLMAGTVSADDADISVRINEVMYNPAGSEVDGEWIEIVNSGDTEVNVTGWVVTDQDGPDDFVFPSMEIPAGGFVVLHAGSGRNITDFSNGAAQFYLFKHSAFLSNSGDDICLMNGSKVMDYVSYGNSSSIDRSPDSREFTPVPSVPENRTIGWLNDTWCECIPTPGSWNRQEGADAGNSDSNEIIEDGASSGTGGEDVNSTIIGSTDNSTEEERNPPLLITDVYYYSLLSEAFTIYNPTNSSVSLSGWSFSDQEGTVFLPNNKTIAPFSHLVLAQNIEGYFEESGVIADINWSELEHSGRFRMNNNGDELLLYHHSSLVDAYIYGDSVYNSSGWTGEPAAPLHSTEVAHRRWVAGHYMDSNSSADWNGDATGIGRSSFYPVSVSGRFNITAFSSPDNSYDALSEAIDSSHFSILLNVYEFTSYPVAEHLIDAARRGVKITMLLEGGPVGGIPEEEIYLCQKMHSAGIDIRFMVNDYAEKINDRYRFDHAKYLVIDDSRLVIMSENIGKDGFSPDHTGNRGWGLVVNSTEIAEYFSSVFENDSDLKMRDIASIEDMPFYSSNIPLHNEVRTTAPVIPPLRCGVNATITPVLSPDSSLSNDTILGMINSAEKSVYVEQFYIYRHWGNRQTGSVSKNPDLYLRALVQAAERGCEVRIILDNTWYNTDPNSTVDNDDTVAYINEIAREEGLKMEAKLISDCHNFTHLHNKGMIVDNRSVLVSSINWNANSVKENREAGLIVESGPIASYFLSLFEKDWISAPPLSVKVLGDGIVRSNETVTLSPLISLDNKSIREISWRCGNYTSDSYYFNLSFNEAGRYDISVRVRDIYGRSANASLNLVVLPQIGEKNMSKSSPAPEETSQPLVSESQPVWPLSSLIFAALSVAMAIIILRVMKKENKENRKKER